jgi:hypothetical protein
MKNYGITFIGKHTVVCVRLNVSSIDTKYMEDKFPDLLYNYYEYRGVDIVRIEGCVKNTEDFHTHYEYAKTKVEHARLSSKMDRLEEDLLIRKKGLIRATIDGIKTYVKFDDIL